MKLPKSEMPFSAFKHHILMFKIQAFSVYEIDPLCHRLHKMIGRAGLEKVQKGNALFGGLDLY